VASVADAKQKSNKFCNDKRCEIQQQQKGPDRYLAIWGSAVIKAKRVSNNQHSAINDCPLHPRFHSVDEISSEKRASHLFYEAGLQAHSDAVHFAGNFVILIHEPDRLRLGSDLQHLRSPSQWKILDQHDHISIGQDIAVCVLHYSGCRRPIRFGRAFPLMTASDTLPPIRVFQNLVHFAHRAHWLAHKTRNILPLLRDIQIRLLFFDSISVTLRMLSMIIDALAH
jgi:hypothetical protein